MTKKERAERSAMKAVRDAAQEWVWNLAASRYGRNDAILRGDLSLASTMTVGFAEAVADYLKASK